jgi:pimeloyl-ACP methyl ester carboxylesterase
MTESLAARFAPCRQVSAGVLDIGYHEDGSANGPTVLLFHGFPYAVETYLEVAPTLAQRGCRVVVPHLRGHGSTRLLERSTPRLGQQATIGVDVIALMDALKIALAVLAGYDWGGRAACVASALWPSRCTGLVSVNSYLIQDIGNELRPMPPSVEAGLWYQHYFQTERGRAGIGANRRELARTLWRRNSPQWAFVGDCPKGEYRRAQPEGTPVSPSRPSEGAHASAAGTAEGRRVHQ